MNPSVPTVVHAAFLPLFCAGLSAFVLVAAARRRRWWRLVLCMACCLALVWWARCRLFDLPAVAAAGEGRSLLALRLTGANLLFSGAVGYGACLLRDLRWRDLGSLRAFRLLVWIAASGALYCAACLAIRALLS